MQVVLTLVCAAMTFALLAPVHAQDARVLSHPSGTPAPNERIALPASGAMPEGAFRKITWDDLLPKDWDPLKEFKGMDLSRLSDGDPRADAVLKRMREVWDNAPANAAMDGAAVRIPGYVVPLEETKSGMKEFLLVPYFGACIHSPPPPSNQIIHVLPKPAPTGLRAMEAVWISGTLKAARADTAMGVSGYRMEAVRVEPYSQNGR